MANKTSSDGTTSNAGRGKSTRQVVVSFVANMGNLNVGMSFGFSATALPDLKRPDSKIKITDSEATWIASLSQASNPIGCILCGFLMDKIGRWKTVTLAEVPLIIGWLIIGFSRNIPMIYIGRLLIGLGSGMVSASTRVYSCEVTQPHLRAILSGLGSVFVSAGVLFEYVVGSVTSWDVLALISAVVPIVSLLGMLFLPETPSHLLTNNKREDAKKALARLRGSTCNQDEEIQRIITFNEKNNIKQLKGKQLINALLAQSSIKPFAILSFYFFVYQWSGINSFTFYTVEAFEASGYLFDKYWLTVSSGIVRFIFTFVGCVLSLKYGHRPLTFFSAIGCGTTMLVLSAYLYLLKIWRENNTQPVLSWIPATSIFLFIIACSLGYLTVPWTMSGELFPVQVRGIMGGMTTSIAQFFIFTAVKTYPPLKRMMGDHGVFGLYAALCFIGLVFFYFLLPETKGKTLQEIEDYICGRIKTLK